MRRSAPVVAVALLLLLAGFLNLARGLDHPGREYRPWALHHASYSDVIAMGGDRYLHGEHPTPYVDDRIEYPVVLGLLLWLPSWAPGGQFGHLALTSLLLALCLVWTVRVLQRIPGANPWMLAVSPALVTYGLLNWDLVGIALLVAGMASIERERHSGVLLGLGVATKLFPAVAFPAFLRVVRRPVGWLVAAIVAVVAVNLPFVVVAFDNWKWFFRFSSKRPPDFAVWNALHITSVPVVNVLSLAALAVAALVALRYGRTPTSARLSTAFVIAVWMITNKVSSPQYSLWVFAAAALVGAPWWVFGALVAGSMFDFACELWLYPRHALTLTPAVTVMVALRTAATACLAWWCLRRLRVAVAGDEGAEGGDGVGGNRAGASHGLDLPG